MAELQHVTDATFEQEVLRAELPVLVEFTADWCQPCHQLRPHLEDLADDNPSRLRVVALDVEANPAMNAQYEVEGLPTTVLFHHGQPVVAVVGALPRRALIEVFAPAVPGLHFKRSLQTILAEQREEAPDDFPRTTLAPEVILVTDANFADLMAEGDEPIAVLVWADWSPTCHRILDLVNRLAKRGEGYRVGALDIDAAPEHGLELATEDLPLLAIYARGQLIHQLHGVEPDDDEWVLEALQAAAP